MTARSPVRAAAVVAGLAAAAMLAALPGCHESRVMTTGTPPAAPGAVTTPAPVTPAPPTRPPELLLVCKADPPSGTVPLTVKFQAEPSGGTGTYDYAWEFGDGETSHQVHPTHTYAIAGQFQASVTVTSGDQARSCEHTITTEGSAPPATPAPGGSPAPLPDLVITIVANNGASSYSPSLADARVGQRVVWRNGDFIFHTATANGGAFDTGFLAPGATRSIVVSAPGTFPYHCTIHPGMVATLRVSP